MTDQCTRGTDYGCVRGLNWCNGFWGNEIVTSLGQRCVACRLVRTATDHQEGSE